MRHAVHVIFLCLVALSACKHQPTQAETEREVLRATFRYFYDEDLSPEEREEAKIVFVAIPGDFESSKDKPLLQWTYKEPSAEWQAALASTGIPIRSVWTAEYKPTDKNVFYADPKTGKRALVFCLHRLEFPDPTHATVLYSREVGPLAGGEIEVKLSREGGVWRVIDSRPGAVY